MVVREIYEASGLLVHPIKDPGTLINYKKSVIDQEVLEEPSLIDHMRVIDQEDFEESKLIETDLEDVAEDVPDAAVTSVKVEVGEIKNDS